MRFCCWFYLKIIGNFSSQTEGLSLKQLSVLGFLSSVCKALIKKGLVNKDLLSAIVYKRQIRQKEISNIKRDQKTIASILWGLHLEGLINVLGCGNPHPLGQHRLIAKRQHETKMLESRSPSTWESPLIL